MRALTVLGLTEDRSSVVLRAGSDTFQLALADVRQAERAAAPVRTELGDGGGTPALSPRDIQQRIRRGESADALAEEAGVPLAAVRRYEGPVLAEREHQTQRVRAALVDGRVVGDLVAEHFARVAPDAVVDWDCWLTDSGRWDVRVQAGGHVVRLRWDSLNRRVHPVDDAARSALLLAPSDDDALGAVLRPVAQSGDATAAPSRPVARPRGSAQVPTWDAIATEVAGRGRQS